VDECCNKVEIRAAIKGRKNNKSPGNDSIPSKLIKYKAEKLQSSLHKLMLEIWKTEQMPSERC
jgi:hypothetical protein